MNEWMDKRKDKNYIPLGINAGGIINSVCFFNLYCKTNSYMLFKTKNTMKIVQPSPTCIANGTDAMENSWARASFLTCDKNIPFYGCLRFFCLGLLVSVLGLYSCLFDDAILHIAYLYSWADRKNGYLISCCRNGKENV